MIIVNGIPYGNTKEVVTTVEHMGMLTKAIEAFFVLYNYNKYTLLDVHVRQLAEGYLRPGWVMIVFQYTLTNDWNDFLLKWGKKDD